MTEDVKAWWEATADYFQAEIDLDVGVNWTGYFAEEPDLLGEVAGRDVLELGCGGGQGSVALALRGADVVGLDLSAAQLAHARDLAAAHGVEAAVDFVEGDVTDLSMFADASFDLAFNAWVFQWVGDLPACFAETHRVLRPGGRFVFSMPHPFYELLDPGSGEVAASYFDTGRYVVEQDEVDADQVLFRHTVSGVYGALVDAGFRVERLREPGSADPEDYEEGPWGEHPPERMSEVPATLVVEATTR